MHGDIEFSVPMTVFGYRFSEAWHKHLGIITNDNPWISGNPSLI
jgi:hypothetical protein